MWQFCVRSAFFLQNIALVNLPWSAVWSGSGRSMDTNRCHRASGCALQARGMAIALSDEFQKSVGLGTNRALTAVYGRSVAGLRASCKTSREPMCLVAMPGGVRGARWTQIDAIAQADMPWRPVEWRLPSQMNCRKSRARALTRL